MEGEVRYGREDKADMRMGEVGSRGINGPTPKIVIFLGCDIATAFFLFKGVDFTIQNVFCTCEFCFCVDFNFNANNTVTYVCIICMLLCAVVQISVLYKWQRMQLHDNG